jgi:hypothetical protein
MQLMSRVHLLAPRYDQVRHNQMLAAAAVIAVRCTLCCNQCCGVVFSLALNWHMSSILIWPTDLAD